MKLFLLILGLACVWWTHHGQYCWVEVTAQAAWNHGYQGLGQTGFWSRLQMRGQLRIWSHGCKMVAIEIYSQNNHFGLVYQVEAQLKCPGAGWYQQPVITGCLPGKMASPKWRRSGSGSERKLHENMLTTYSLTYIHLIFIANNIKKCFWFTIQSVWALLRLRLRQKSSGKWDEKSSHEM